MTLLSPDGLAALFDEAQDLHQAGRLAEALERYKRILAANPAHAPTLHMTGVLALQNGQNDVAIDLMRQAVGAGAGSASLYSNLGLALRAAGRLDEAILSVGRALSLNPGAAETHNNLGMALAARGELDVAAESFSRAVMLNPGLAAAQASLGEVRFAQGKLAEAEACLLKARALAPGDADVLKSLSLLALAQGDAGNAVRHVCQALALDDTPPSHRIFSEVVQAVRWEEDDPGLRHYLVRAVTEGWSRPAVFAGIGFSLIKARLAEGGRLEEDALLAALLKATPITDVLLERELTAARRALLLEGGQAGDFAAALAQQCFLNEYVWSFAADEAAEVARLQQEPQAFSEAQWVLLACYLPLGGVSGAERLAAKDAGLAAILRQQRDEPVREKALAALLPALTSLEDAALAGVRARYEEAPYPRWIRIGEAGSPANLRSYLANRFAGAPLQDRPDAPSVLVAGCGTGQYALEMARDFAMKGMLAVDISRASLAYAARKAEEAGIGHIRFALADILQIGAAGASFDVIECRGVLHHLPDAFAGFQALLTCLNPGGVLLVAFHSSRGRRPIAELRDWVRRQGASPSMEEVRALRAQLMAMKERFGHVLGLLPFYASSACRELLFAQNEQTHTLDQIAFFLEESGVRLLGVDVAEPVRAAYRQRFPGDPAATDLRNWSLFEDEHPETFAGMYNLWIQKP
jgi:tetratricopeptide (TPR) repeat protein/SAM-dependent methyltransferase